MAGRPRQVSISDQLWEIYGVLEEESGSSVDTLISQAMFEMAVKLGYINPVPVDSVPPQDMEDEEFDAQPARPRRQPVAAAKASSPPPAAKPPRPPAKPAAGGGKKQQFAQGRTKEASRAPASAGGGGKRPPRPAPRQAPKDEPKHIYIQNEDGDSEKIDKDIYIIGRSSKCDLVINSVKVSREHAIITRERGDFFIEDLGSANGTWHKGERIEKMKIRDGDEIFICDEKFKFVLR